MKSSRIYFVLLPLFMLSLFLFGCAQSSAPASPTTHASRTIRFQNGSFDSNAAEVTVALKKGESRLLERFDHLTTVDLTGSESIVEVDEYAKAHPDVQVRCTIELLGQSVPFDASSIATVGSWNVESIQQAIDTLPYLSSLDIRSCALENAALLSLFQANPTLSIRCMVSVFGEKADNQAVSLVIPDGEGTPEEIETTLREALPLFPALTSLDLTQQQAELSPETILQFQQEFPAMQILYTFQLYGREINTTDTTLDLYEVRVKNEGVPELEKVLACLPDCTYADMAYTKIDNETMSALAAKFPNIKFSWMIHFAAYSCRTDANMLKASKPFYGFTSDVADILKYCTDLEYLDIGHNQLTDLSFLSNMKHLKVLIAAISFNIADISPVANCTELEYLELFSNRIVDVSPLANLTNLKHLNICNNRIVDASPLYALQNLERLWIANNPLSDTQKTELIKHLPNCKVNVTTHNPTAEGWDLGERYDLLSEQFHYGSAIIYERFGNYSRP